MRLPMLSFFKKLKESQRIKKEVFDYFKIEKTEKGTLLLGDFADKNFSNWLSFIHRGIQEAMKKKLINGKAIENYVNLTFYLGGQRVDIAIIKDGKKSPHELIQELKNGGKE
jgi:hypothetical protein